MEFFSAESIATRNSVARVAEARLVDAHVHSYEYSADELEAIKSEGIMLVSVAEDYESSLKNLELSEREQWVKPCVGIHPWNVGKASRSVLKDLEKLASEMGAICVGEIGLDTKFVPETIERQREFFTALLRIARDLSLAVNLHAAGTWREVFEALLKFDIESALFHWYTGPLDLLEEITDQGYYISINPALKVQEKHRQVAEAAELDAILLESDGPYNYRGMRLNSLMLREVVGYLARAKGRDETYVMEKVFMNAVHLFPGILK